jgi:preprotein translocase subunit SecD
MIVMGSEQTVYISENVVLSNKDIVETRVIPGVNHPLIEITLTNEGTEKFAIATEDNLNNPLGIIINGRLISAPIVQEKINARTAIISGSFSEEEAEQIANGIAPW